MDMETSPHQTKVAILANQSSNIRRLCVNALHSEGYQLLETYYKGYDLMDAEIPNIIIIDYALSDKTADEVIQHVTSNGKNPPFIILLMPKSAKGTGTLHRSSLTKIFGYIEYDTQLSVDELLRLLRTKIVVSKYLSENKKRFNEINRRWPGRFGN